MNLKIKVFHVLQVYLFISSVNGTNGWRHKNQSVQRSSDRPPVEKAGGTDTL